MTFEASTDRKLNRNDPKHSILIKKKLQFRLEFLFLLITVYKINPKKIARISTKTLSSIVNPEEVVFAVERVVQNLLAQQRSTIPKRKMSMKVSFSFIAIDSKILILWNIY
jgi:hypothetical protein